MAGETYTSDDWTNIPESVARLTSRKLHLKSDHPLGIIRSFIEGQLPTSTYAHYNTYHPVVTTAQNFDSLGFPADHVGRSRSDTYYVDAGRVLRTHTSAHQVDTFRDCPKPGFLIAADVYRRDEIDRSHYPVFHQMEGARRWKLPSTSGASEDDGKEQSAVEALVAGIDAEVAAMPKLSMVVEDDNPPNHPDRNPVQPEHYRLLSEAVARHLKRTLEGIAVAIFGAAAQARRAASASASASVADAAATGGGDASVASGDEPLRVRWIEAYFPFTSPSWELEVLWEGEWLELCGCGVTRHAVMANAGRSDEIAWAFGLGLERLAMVLFGVPDIRLFWSTDTRFLSQFKAGTVTAFRPYSKYPPNIQDVSFWVPLKAQAQAPQHGAAAAGGAPTDVAPSRSFGENDLMEIVRDVGGDLVESVKLVDRFEQVKKQRESLCYRLTYRSMDRSLSNEEVGTLQEQVRARLRDELGVELR